jgi:hypothetical protein
MVWSACVVCVCSTQAGMDAQIWLIGNSGPTTPHLSALRQA